MGPTITPLWERFDHYETAVTLIVQDILKSGDTFFDVGANIGGISVSASRTVGPMGRVIAFEASPRIITQMLTNLQSWHASNVHVMPYAVWSESGEVIPLYYGGAHFADSVVVGADQGQPDAFVETISLDVAVQMLGCVPSLVKFDIEGAEQEALKGFTQTIGKYSPTCILEMVSNDASLTQWMENAGYKLFHCDTYQRFELDTSIARTANVLCIHQNNTELLDFYENVGTEVIAELGPDDWQDDGESPYLSISDIEPGRYLFQYEPFEEAFSDQTFVELNLMAGEPWVSMTAHGSRMAHLATSYSTMPFHLRRQQTIVFRVLVENSKSRFSRSKFDINKIRQIFNRVRVIKLLSTGETSAPWETEAFRL